VKHLRVAHFAELAQGVLLRRFEALRTAIALSFLCLFALNVLAEPVRITTWRMDVAAGAPIQGTNSETLDKHVNEAALGMQKLHPDVIILEGVRDWQMCGQIVEALKPAEYNVVVCSSFRDPRGGTASRDQVAILAKRRAYFSWSEGWRAEGESSPSGGFAFAAIQFGKQRFGFFAVQLDPRFMPNSSSPIARTAQQQWLQGVDSFKHWVTNRLDAGVIGGTFTAAHGDAKSLPETAFGRNFLRPVLDEPLTLPRRGEETVSATEVLFAPIETNPEGLPGLVLDKFPATVDLVLNPPGTFVATPPTAKEKSAFPVTNVPANPQTSATQTAKSTAVVPGPQAPQIAHENNRNPVMWVFVGTMIAAGAISVGLLFFARRGQRKTRTVSLLTAGKVEEGNGFTSSSYTVTLRPLDGNGSLDSLPDSDSPSAMKVETSMTNQSQPQVWQPPVLGVATPDNEAMRARLLPQLSQWLKEKLVRRLIEDRADLVATQELATQKALEVEERLARIEVQLEQQNSAYELRISQLTRELLASKAENRHLIEAQIVKVKAEMQAARARALAQAQSEPN
jgi:hypothetical protein